MIPSLTECFICNCVVPVGIWSSIFLVLIVVKVELIRMFGWNIRDHILIERIIRIVCNCIDSCFTQSNIVYLSAFIQLEADITGFNHLVGIKQFCFSIPVKRILGEDLFVALQIGCHGIASIVPHGLIVDCFIVFNTHLINQCLWCWIQAVIGPQRIEIWLWSQTMVNNGIIIRCFKSNHFTEFGTFSRIQCIRFFCGQGLGIFIILFCTFNHFQWHRSISGIVFMEVEYPFQTGCKVLCITICLFLTVYIDPFYTFAKFKGPSQTAIFSTPFFCNCRYQFTFCINLQQTINQICQVLTILLSLCIQDVEGFQFTANCHRNYQIFDLIFRRCFFFLLCTASFPGSSILFSGFLRAAAASQCQHTCQKQRHYS